jgi:hypothetical protein
MTDRDVIINCLIFVTECDKDADWTELEHSIVIHSSNTKILFLPDGRIRSIIRAGKSYGPGEKS